MSETIEATMARLRKDFIDSTRDKLDDIEVILDLIYRDQPAIDQSYVTMLREIHSIKGSAGTFGFPSITTITHRLEDYLSDVAMPSREQVLDTQKFVDQIRVIVEEEQEPSESALSVIVDNLPVHRQRNFSTQDQRNITVLLVMPKSLQRRVLGEELRSLGFDVSFVDDPLQAITLTMSIKPDVVISSFELGQINGAEFASIMQVVGKTASIPFLLVTAHKRDSAVMRDVPASARVVEKGSNVVEAIAEELVDLGLFGEAFGLGLRRASA